MTRNAQGRKLAPPEAHGGSETLRCVRTKSTEYSVLRTCYCLVEIAFDELHMPEAPPRHPQRGRWQFSLRSMLIAATLFAILFAPAAYFGWVGLLAAAIVAAVVGCIWFLGRKPAIVEVLVVTVLISILTAMIIPTSPRGPSYRNACRNNLKQLALAMHMYHEQHGSFPPAYVADENGTPMHSWRVLLLPYLEEKM